MSPEQLNERFLAAAALPPELDLAEATQLFLNPTPRPKPWYKSLMIMLSTLALFCSVLFSLLPAADTPQLSAFPITIPVAAPALPANAPLPPQKLSVSPTPSLTEPDIAPTAPPAPTSPAPASPKNQTAPAVSNPPTSPLAPPGEQSTSMAPEPSSTTNNTYGQWEYRRKALLLKPDGPSAFSISIYLDPVELQKVQDHKNEPTAIQRAAGTLILKEGRRNGTYEFIPNTTFRNQLNERGMGDANFRPENLPETGNTINPQFELIRSAANPKDLLWLRYFITNINEDYLGQLETFGYTEAELQDTWLLAIAQIYPESLERILANCKRMFTDRPPLADLRLLYHSPLTAWMSPNDSFPMPYAKYQQNYQADESGLFILRQPAAPIFPDTSQLPLTPFVNLKPAGAFTLNTTGAIADTLQITNLSLLKVKGRIRLYLDKSLPEGQVIMYKKAGDLINVKRRSNRLIISNECGADNVDITANPAGIKSLVTGKCAIMFFGGDDE